MYEVVYMTMRHEHSMAQWQAGCSYTSSEERAELGCDQAVAEIRIEKLVCNYSRMSIRLNG